MAIKKKIIQNKKTLVAEVKESNENVKTAPLKKSPAAKKTVEQSPAKAISAPIEKIVTKPKKPASNVKKAAQAVAKELATAPTNKVAGDNKAKGTVASSLTIKSDLTKLMPEYDRSDEKIGDDYMHEGKKIHFRLLLNNWKKQLMQQVDRTVDYMKDEATNFPDPIDRASQEEEFSLELRTRDRERKLIKKIDEALERLDDDEYGYCEACGIEIGYKRLEARPTATLCIDCKTVDEIRERQLAT